MKKKYDFKRMGAAMMGAVFLLALVTSPVVRPEKMLPLLCDGSAVCIGIPGIKDEYSNRSEELLHPWLKDEAYMFRSPTQWKEIIGQNERIAHVETWKMECFEAAWEDWFRTGHPYANVDHTLYESIIAPYSCSVGIFVQLH